MIQSLVLRLLCFVGLSLFFFASLSSPLSAIHAESQPAPVLLAHSWKPGMAIQGWWMSEKLDGIRGYWTGSQFVSRAGNVFAVPDWFTKNFPSVALDGELWIGRQTFAQIASIVRRKTPHKEWQSVRYMIFDAPQAGGGFEQRMDFAREWFEQHPNPYVSIIQHEVCKDEQHLRKRLAEVEALGGEGLILRQPESAYTVGRSSTILKVKTFQDAEAVVLEHLPGSGRNAGRMGAIQVELPNGIQFAVGSGFSDAERDNPPPVGSTVRFKHQGFTKAGVPRFASFLRVRERF
jgi:DNA ligase-1